MLDCRLHDPLGGRELVEIRADPALGVCRRQGVTACASGLGEDANELLVFALRRAGERIEERIRRLPAAGTPLEHLRDVIAELLPLDAARRDEALVWLAFIARSGVDPALAPESERIWYELHAPFVHHLARAIGAGQLSARLDTEREGTRLQALVDGLVVHLVSAPKSTSPELALAVVDDHLGALRGAD